MKIFTLLKVSLNQAVNLDQRYTQLDDLHCVHTLTWFGAFSHGAVINLVLKLGPVVVHVDHVDVQIYRVLHLVPIHVHCMSPELETHRHQKSFAFGAESELL